VSSPRPEAEPALVGARSVNDTVIDATATWAGVSERALRLFAVACCRRVWNQLAPDCRRAVDAAERFADGAIGPEELAEAWRAAGRLEGLRRLVVTEDSERAFLAGRAQGFRYYQYTEHVHRVASATLTLEDARAVANDLRPWRGDSLENDEVDAAHGRISQDVFGGRARSVAFDAAWRTPAVMSLARSLYDRQDFARMPKLADDLEAAGCRDADLLAHCRSGLEHVRGCWALDAILDR
jgi:hypothetical protein